MTYDPNQRLAEPGEDDTRAERIEVSFAIPVWLTHEHQCMLHRLVNSICDYGPNVPADGVHWPSGYGSKPKWSRADARFLGKEVGVLDDDAPESGEPTFDDAVLFLETSARGFVSDGERARIAKRKPTADEPEAFPEVTNCAGCGKTLLPENAWMEDGCPCNAPPGVNDGNQLISQWRAEEGNRLRIEVEQLKSQRAALLDLFLKADKERMSETSEAHVRAAKWKAEGDMYGWNFHEGRAAGMATASLIFYRILRAIKADMGAVTA